MAGGPGSAHGVCGAPHPRNPHLICQRWADHRDVATQEGRRTDWHVGRDVTGDRHVWKPQPTWRPRPMTDEGHAGGTVARRMVLETELREQARQLLALEAGALAVGPTAFTDLETALDYLQALVQDGGQ